MAGARSPLLGALLSFLLPGLGQLYAGRPRRALLFLVPAMVGWAALLYAASQGRFALLGYLFNEPLLITLLVFNAGLFLLHGWAIVDAYSLVSATRARRGAVLARRGSSAGALGVMLLLLATLVVHGLPEWYGYQVAVRLPAFSAAASPAIPTPSWLVSPTPSGGLSPTPGLSGNPTASPTSPSPRAAPRCPEPHGQPMAGSTCCSSARMPVRAAGAHALTRSTC